MYTGSESRGPTGASGSASMVDSKGGGGSKQSRSGKQGTTASDGSASASTAPVPAAAVADGGGEEGRGGAEDVKKLDADFPNASDGPSAVVAVQEGAATAEVVVESSEV